MTTLNTVRSAAGSRGTGFTAAINLLVGRIATWNDARITRNALAKLSEHELEDIGLSRGDIDSIR
jgi:uncharacterized protein YjiS (DUF1127 family)